MNLKLPLLAAIGLSLCSCDRARHDNEAIRQAVMDYAKTKASLDLTRLDVAVTSVSFRDREADAVVAFRDKNNGGDPAMRWNYTLESDGQKWIVKGKGRPVSSMSGGQFSNPHGATGTGPTAPAPSQTLPPGHPTLPSAPPEQAR